MIDVTTQASPGSESRIRLSRERVLRAAVAVADERGIESLTMRRLAEVLGAEAMSLYYHVSNKDDLLDGVVDLVGREINEAVADPPATGGGWKDIARRRILTAREVLLRHRWAPAVFESRTAASPEVLRYLDGLLGIMRGGGFSSDLAHHAMHALGSRAFGFTQELFTPAGAAPPSPDALDHMAAQLPNLVAMLRDISHDDHDSTLGWCDDQAEFEFGLDLVLDGLDRLRGTR